VPGYPSSDGHFGQWTGGGAPDSTGDAPARGHFFEDPTHSDSVAQFIREGVLPLRYAYAGSAAFTHDRLAWSDGYRAVIGSVELEVRALDADGDATACLSRVVEIGPGNGVHTVALLQTLVGRGFRCLDYLGLDFSATLLDLAISRIRETFGGALSLRHAVWDIESGLSAYVEQWRCGNGSGGPVLACLLGHTLGNVESGLDVLEHVHGSLRAGDILMAGVTLHPPSAEYAMVLAPYRTDVFRAAALEPLHAAGIEPDDVQFDVHFADGVVVGQAEFRRSVRVGQWMVPSGHILRCFCSRRFVMDDVRTMFTRTGWEIRSVTKDDKHQHAVVLATRGKP
jgi:L-histidine Nalpha-methyltransferase